MSKQIMVIDDSATVREILRVGLSRVGFTVNCFPDGIEAFKNLSQAETSLPDLIILDIGLPRMDGYEVAHRLKQKPQFGSIPIVIVSRRDGVIDRLKGRLAGASVYLTKPFQINEVIDVIAAQLKLGPAPHLYQV